MRNKLENLRTGLGNGVRKVKRALASLNEPLPAPEGTKMSKAEFTPGEIEEIKEIITTILKRFGSERTPADAASFFKKEAEGHGEVSTVPPALADIFDTMAFGFGEHQLWATKPEITLENATNVLKGYLRRRHGVEIELR
jgi:hypothetical protein